jgi:hypothetical protein
MGPVCHLFDPAFVMRHAPPVPAGNILSNELGERFNVMKGATLFLIPYLLLIAGRIDGQPDGAQKMEEKKTTLAVAMRDIEFSIALPKKSLAGNGLDLVVALKNQSKEEVGFYNGTFRSLSLKMVDAKGAPVNLTRFGERTIGESAAKAEGGRRTIFVAPGKSITETINLARLFDLSVPGDYKVSLKRVLNEDSPLRPVMPLEIKDIAFKVVEPTR